MTCVDETWPSCPSTTRALHLLVERTRAIPCPTLGAVARMRVPDSFAHDVARALPFFAFDFGGARRPTQPDVPLLWGEEDQRRLCGSTSAPFA
eukprot:1803260-Pleurochrysis_carterae.AAC.3